MTDRTFQPETLAIHAGQIPDRETGSLQIPNGIISRFPIIESGSWDDPVLNNREFAWAHLRLPEKRAGDRPFGRSPFYKPIVKVRLTRLPPRREEPK